MGAILHPERFLRHAVYEIGSEKDAMDAVACLATSGEGDGPGLADLSRSGLLAIATPSTYGGADLTNAALLEVVRHLAAVSLPLAHCLVAHFTAIEILRNTTGHVLPLLQHVGRGVRLVAVIDQADEISDPAYGEYGLADVPGAAPETWFVVLEKEALAVRLVRRDAGNTIARPASGADLLDGAVLETVPEVAALVGAISDLFSAGIYLGDLARLQRDASAASRDDTEIVIAHETVAALAHRVGSAIDMAQISPSQGNIAEAARLAAILRHVQNRSRGELF